MNPQAANLERIAQAYKMSLAKLAELEQEVEPVAAPTEEDVLERLGDDEERRPRRLVVEREFSAPDVVTGKWVEK